MKITAVRPFFCGNNHYVRILTDEGISGVDESTLNIAHIWQDIATSNFCCPDGSVQDW